MEQDSSCACAAERCPSLVPSPLERGPRDKADSIDRSSPVPRRRCQEPIEARCARQRSRPTSGANAIACSSPSRRATTRSARRLFAEPGDCSRGSQTGSVSGRRRPGAMQKTFCSSRPRVANVCVRFRFWSLKTPLSLELFAAILFLLPVLPFIAAFNARFIRFK